MFASEYGWTLDYILYSVYPADAFMLVPMITDRKMNTFIDQVQIQIMADPMIDENGRKQSLQTLNSLRPGVAEAQLKSRPFNRSSFEQLRAAMGRKKGAGPVRID